MAVRYPSCVTKASARSGISKGRLLKSYKRGIGAWKTNPGSVRNVRGVKGGPGPKMSSQRWARARVNSFCRGSKKHDRDLR